MNVSVNGKDDLADAPRSLVHAEFHLFSGSPLSCASLFELLDPENHPDRAANLVLDLVMVACTLVHRLGGISAEISTAVGLVIIDCDQERWRLLGGLVPVAVQKRS